MRYCKCPEIEHAFDGKPFVPPNGGVQDKTYTCSCGQMWWQYNTYYHLWSKVNDQTTMENIKRGCPEPVAIGNPSKNLDLLIDKDD